jgi:hypothetical protein
VPFPVRRVCVRTALLGLLLAGRGTALVTIGTSHPEGSSSALAVAGDVAFVALGAAGLQLVDVSDPHAPVDLSLLDTPGEVSAVEVVGGLAYVADGPGGLRIVDVSDPAAPVELGSTVTPGGAVGLSVVGGIVWVAAGSGGLQSIDVSDPSAPTGLGVLATTGYASSVDVEGTLAYVAEGSSLRVVDVSDPSAPLERGVLPSAFLQQIVDVTVAGGLAYVLATECCLGPFTGSASLLVVDVSDPAQPTVLASRPTRPFAQRVELEGGVAYLAGRDFLALVDVSNPSAPVEIGALGLRWTADVEVVDGLAYLAGSPGLRVVDLAEPTLPAPVGEIPVQAGNAEAVGTRLYLAEGSAGLRIWDVADPAAPAELGGAQIEATDVALAGDLAFVVGVSGLRVLDVRDPAAPLEVGALPVPGKRIEVEQDRAYVLDDGSLRVIDISRPALPVELGVLGFEPGGPTELDVEGTRVYVGHRLNRLGAAPLGSLRVVDASKARRPREIGVLDIEVGVPHDVEAAGGYVHLAVGWSGGSGLSLGYLKAVDVSRGRQPVEVGSRLGSFELWDVEVVGGLAYVVDSNFGVRVFDVSDPASPLEIGAVPGGAFDLEVEGGIAFASRVSGWEVLGFGPQYARVPATIELRTGGRRHFVDPRRRGVASVALLGSEGLDVSELDPATLAFGPAGAPAIGRIREGDVNRDGHPDLRLRFDRQQAGIALGERGACVRGRLRDGTLVEGCDRLLTPAPPTGPASP